MSVQQNTPAFGYGKFPNGPRGKVLMNRMTAFHLADRGVATLSEARKAAALDIKEFFNNKITTQQEHDALVDKLLKQTKEHIVKAQTLKRMIGLKGAELEQRVNERLKRLPEWMHGDVRKDYAKEEALKMKQELAAESKALNAAKEK